MRTLRKGLGKLTFGLLTLAAVLVSHPALATDIKIHLPDAPLVSRKDIRYQCDRTGPSIGLPAGPFEVEYIDGGGNSLAVVPISGNALIFANVSAASGVRVVLHRPRLAWPDRMPLIYRNSNLKI